MSRILLSCLFSPINMSSNIFTIENDGKIKIFDVIFFYIQFLV